MQTVIRAVTTAVLLALLAGVTLKMKVFGNGPQPFKTPNHQVTNTRPRGEFFVLTALLSGCLWDESTRLPGPHGSAGGVLQPVSVHPAA